MMHRIAYPWQSFKLLFFEEGCSHNKSVTLQAVETQRRLYVNESAFHVTLRVQHKSVFLLSVFRNFMFSDERIIFNIIFLLGHVLSRNKTYQLITIYYSIHTIQYTKDRNEKMCPELQYTMDKNENINQVKTQQATMRQNVS